MLQSNLPNRTPGGTLRPAKKVSLAASLLMLPFALLLTNCGQHATSPAPEPQPARMFVKTILDPVGTLGKGSEISYSKVIVSGYSSVGDTLHDTITASTVPALNPASSSPQALVTSYVVPTVRSWKMIVRVYDSRDSVTHADSATTPVLLPGDFLTVNMSLSSLFTQYEAKFADIPDSVSFDTVSTGIPIKQALHLSRLTMEVDERFVVDSTSSPAPYFTPLDTAVLSYDYVRVGSRNIRLSAYGVLGDGVTPELLYQGAATISVGTGVDQTVVITLGWKGPLQGGGSLTVTIGRIGKVIVIGQLPGGN
jgi:hypothetical protein